jgi:hypothetical protein
MLVGGALVIIADRRDQLPRLLAAATMLMGVIAWIVFRRRDLILSHYDAKAHLVVARRIFDNLTPGWQQIGAVWLPLPHLLNTLPVQFDVLYRTGLVASAISIGSFGVTAYAVARLVLAATSSPVAAVAAVASLSLNPNLLYIQSTPLTEPLLLALTSLVVLWMYEWAVSPRDEVPRRLGWAMVGAALTRYEAWPVIAASIGAALYVKWRQGTAWSIIALRFRQLAIWPGVAIVAFLINSRITIGQWFVSDGFFVPDPTFRGQPLRTFASLLWGTHALSGYVPVIFATAAVVFLAMRALVFRQDAALLVPLASFAAGVLPFAAFYVGHPYRIRYMIPLVAASALVNGIALGRSRRAAPLLGAVLVACAFIESPPWLKTAPMLLEAQWDVPASVARRRVSDCLTPLYHGEKVLASMGSLAHYMQELSARGFRIADFIHEGNGVIWDLALEDGPAPHAGWMLVEEYAEGGDVLATKIRHDARFAAGMARVCEGGGVALYRRVIASGEASMARGSATTSKTEPASKVDE